MNYQYSVKGELIGHKKCGTCGNEWAEIIQKAYYRVFKCQRCGEERINI